MCWAQPEPEDEDAEAAAEPLAELDPDAQAIEGFVMPPHDTKH